MTHADAFLVGAEAGCASEMVLLKPDYLREWYSAPQARSRAIDALKQRGIILPGRDPSTNTIQKQIACLGEKRMPYHALSPARLIG